MEIYWQFLDDMWQKSLGGWVGDSVGMMQVLRSILKICVRASLYDQSNRRHQRKHTGWRVKRFISQHRPKCPHICQRTESETTSGHFPTWHTMVWSFHNACVSMNVNKPLHKTHQESHKLHFSPKLQKTCYNGNNIIAREYIVSWSSL